MNTKRLKWKVYICNKTKYAGNYGITIMLMFKNFLIKIIDNSYSNSELYLNFKIYLLNLGIYLYHKKNSHISNLKLIIKSEIKNMMSSIILSLSKKKLIYKFYMLLFVNIYFFKSQK